MSAFMRGGQRLAVLLVATAACLLALGAPAFAHAVLEHSTPPAGSVLKQSPDELSLTFGESVIASSQAIRLYDDHLGEVPLGDVTHPAGRGDVVVAPVTHRLHPGTYTVTWRITSADTHVVSGSFTFSVGHATTVSGVPPSEGGSSETGPLESVVRGLGYAGLVTGPGALVVIVWLWPAGLARRRIRRLVIGGGVLLAVATIAGVVVQGADAAGVSLGHGFDGSALRLGMAGHFGRAAAARLVLLIVIAELAILGRAGGRVPALRITVVAAALAATWPYAGHSGTGDLAPLAFVADWVHVAAMATWLGGLAMLLAGPLRGGGAASSATEPAAVTGAFSEWALNAVTLLVATGLFAAWRNVRELGALTATHYGHLLLWKTGFVVAVLFLARLSRRHVAGRDGADLGGQLWLRRAVGAETFGAVVILAITGFLTGTPPASQTYAPAFTRTATDSGITVVVHVDRTGVGTTRLVVSTTRGGEVQRITQIEGSLSELDPPVGPLPVSFKGAGPGREVAALTFPDAGDWSLELRVQTSAITAIAVATTIHVR